MKDFQYHVNGRTVIAVGTYHGETIRATAKCAPDDEFDVHTGIDLAGARLRQKLVKRQISTAKNRIRYLTQNSERLATMLDKNEDSLAETEEYLETLEAQLDEAEDDAYEAVYGW